MAGEQQRGPSRGPQPGLQAAARLDEARIRGDVVVERELTSEHRFLRFTVPKIHAPPLEAAWRLDRYLHALLPTISRTLIQRWVDQGAALVDGERVPSQHKLKGGSLVELRAPLPARDAAAAPPAALDILYRDRWLLVVNKPPGQLAHQAGRTMTGTLVNQLQEMLQAEGLEGTRARLVNRIDRDTSGIVLVSLDEAAHARMAKAMESRSLRKEYLAIVQGRPDPPAGSWRDPIGEKTDGSIARMVREDGQSAHTDYRLIEAAPGDRYALVRLTLHTGRQHQIRVHAAHHGHALVGDWMYGQPCRELAGQALHSALLGLPHPQTGEPLVIEAPLPAAFATLWRSLASGGAVETCELSAEQRSKLHLSADAQVRRPSWLSAEEFERLRDETGSGQVD